MYTGLLDSDDSDDNTTSMADESDLEQVKIPRYVNWKARGKVTPVKNQVGSLLINIIILDMQLVYHTCHVYSYAFNIIGKSNSAWMWFLLCILCYWCSGISICYQETPWTYQSFRATNCGLFM